MVRSPEVDGEDERDGVAGDNEVLLLPTKNMGCPSRLKPFRMGGAS